MNIKVDRLSASNTTKGSGFQVKPSQEQKQKPAVVGPPAKKKIGKKTKTRKTKRLLRTPVGKQGPAQQGDLKNQQLEKRLLEKVREKNGPEIIEKKDGELIRPIAPSLSPNDICRMDFMPDDAQQYQTLSQMLDNVPQIPAQKDRQQQDDYAKTEKVRIENRRPASVNYKFEEQKPVPQKQKSKLPQTILPEKYSKKPQDTQSQDLQQPVVENIDPPPNDPNADVIPPENLPSMQSPKDPSPWLREGYRDLLQEKFSERNGWAQKLKNFVNGDPAYRPRVLNPRTEGEKKDPNNYLTKAEMNAKKAFVQGFHNPQTGLASLTQTVLEFPIRALDFGVTVARAGSWILPENLAIRYASKQVVGEYWHPIDYIQDHGTKPGTEWFAEKVWNVLSDGVPYEAYAKTTEYYTKKLSETQAEAQSEIIKREKIETLKEERAMVWTGFAAGLAVDVAAGGWGLLHKTGIKAGIFAPEAVHAATSGKSLLRQAGSLAIRHPDEGVTFGSKFVESVKEKYNEWFGNSEDNKVPASSVPESNNQPANLQKKNEADSDSLVKDWRKKSPMLPLPVEFKTSAYFKYNEHADIERERELRRDLLAKAQQRVQSSLIAPLPNDLKILQSFN